MDRSHWHDAEGTLPEDIDVGSDVKEHWKGIKS